MATARPVVSVYQFDAPSEKKETVPMPQVLASPLRPDLVRYIHTNMAKNKRQAMSVKAEAGHETCATSWRTGRAVARIPRVSGGGTHRAGQGAYGNMARGGHMFSATRTWRRWHRRVNVTQKRHAVATALAASTLPPLVMARGHRIGQVAELPLVVSDGIESMTKTKQAIEVLKKLGCEEELKKIVDSKKIRAGRGKMRNRRYTMRKGPLVVYLEDNGIVRAMRNIPGVETACVTRLNLLKLAPGGNFGRFIIWTQGAFKKLTDIYGTSKSGAPLKKNYHLPRAQMENADLDRIINSTEVQSSLKPKLEAPKKFQVKVNPLKSKRVMAELNPFAAEKGSTDKAAAQKRKAERVKASKEHNKKHKKGDETFYKTLMKAFAAKAAEPEKKDDEEKDAEDDE